MRISSNNGEFARSDSKSKGLLRLSWSDTEPWGLCSKIFNERN